MTGFCALAIKSTLIPPITTFKREERGKKWLEGLEEKSFQVFFAFPSHFSHPLESYLIHSVKACASFGWLDTGLYNPD